MTSKANRRNCRGDWGLGVSIEEGLILADFLFNLLVVRQNIAIDFLVAKHLFGRATFGGAVFATSSAIKRAACMAISERNCVSLSFSGN